MSDLLTEVDEAMRQERVEKFWHENKTFIILFVILTIVATGGLSTYRSWDAKVKIKQTSELIALQQSTTYPANIIDDELNFRPSLRGIALLSAAGTAMQRDNKTDAQKLYARLAKDTKIPDEFRFLGILMDTRLKSDLSDTSNEDLLSALQPVLNSKNAWKPHAQIDAALLQSEQKPDRSLALLNEVADTPDLPPSLYERAQKLHDVISEQRPQDDAKTSTDNVETN